MDLKSALKELNCYSKPASQKELDVQYKKLAKIRHPDVGGTKESFQRLVEAYKYLSEYKEDYSRFEKNKNSTETSNNNMHKFVQILNIKIRLIYFICYILGIKIRTHKEYTYIKLKKKNIILSELPKNCNHLYHFRVGTVYSRNFKPQKGFVQAFDEVFIYFFK